MSSDIGDPTADDLLQHQRDTEAHIATVQVHLFECAEELEQRAETHDQSKLQEPEASAFAAVSGELEETEYGTDEYKSLLDKLRGGPLEHHYEVNDHHPEHFENGIEDMNLLQLVEMVCDWAAAVERHDDENDLHDSIEKNQERFGYSDELKSIFHQTADRLYANETN